MSSDQQRVLMALLGDPAPRRFSLLERRTIEAAPRGMTSERLVLATVDGARIRAILTGPQGPWRDLPALLYCHAHGGRYHIGASELVEGRPALQSPPYGLALAEAGFVALCIDLPCFGERAGDGESELAKRLLWSGRTLFGEMIGDQIAALDILASLPGVDPDRIGVMGLSMGATLSFWLAALEPRLRAAAHLCCFADLAALVRSGAHDLHGIYMTVPGLLDRFSTGAIAGLVAPRPQLACMGIKDPLTPPDAIRIAVAEVEAAYAKAQAPWAFETVIDPHSGHVETPAMREAVLAFLARSLVVRPR